MCILLGMKTYITEKLIKRIIIKSMIGKLFKILGAVAVVAMLATNVLVVPVAAISSVALTVGSTEIYNNTPYTIRFTLWAPHNPPMRPVSLLPSTRG